MANIKFKIAGVWYSIPTIKGDKGDTGSIADLGGDIAGLPAKTTPVDADSFVISDSASANVEKKLTWVNVKATLKSYLDGFFAPKNNPTFSGEVISNGQITSKSSVMMMGNSGGTINGYLFNDSSGISLLDSTGVTKINVNKASGDVDIMSRLNLTSGQVKFPATQVPSSDPTTLDYYEEGLWTPTTPTANLSITINESKYTRIGRLVIANCYVTLNNSAASSLASYRIAGLPFNSNGYGFASNYFQGGFSNGYIEADNNYAIFEQTLIVGSNLRMIQFIYHAF